MLTEHEEKLIQRYYIYPKIAITAVIMALALGVPFILLEMIDDLVFHDEEVIFWGLYVSSSPIIPQLPRAPWPWGLPAA